MAEVCYIGDDYEPESYQEMRDTLNGLQTEQEKLIKGFYPSDFNIGINVNYEYQEMEDCDLVLSLYQKEISKIRKIRYERYVKGFKEIK